MILHRDRLESCRYNNNYNDRIIIMCIFTISSEPLMNGLRICGFVGRHACN